MSESRVKHFKVGLLLLLFLTFCSNPHQNQLKGREHQELFIEIYRVVFLSEPDSEKIEQFAGALSQGASLEGLYNGFTHSEVYRKLESTGEQVSAESLKKIVEILSELEAELPNPSSFNRSSALPLPVLFPTQLSELDSDLQVDSKREELVKIFENASFFTLKRVLGDEALKVITTKKNKPEILASWYSTWVIQMASRNTDFGLALRNRPDKNFHYQWAMRTSIDRIIWEVLNRVHRVINHAMVQEGQKVKSRK